MSNHEYYTGHWDEILNLLGSDAAAGLTQAEVVKRQQIYSNELQTVKKAGPLSIFIKQFTDTMVLVLLAATTISGLIGNMADALTIMAIVIINAILGFAQEFRAERSLDALKKLAAPNALVLREGKKSNVPASQLVPGDIVFLEAGDKIPADARLLESIALEMKSRKLLEQARQSTQKSTRSRSERAKPMMADPEGGMWHIRFATYPPETEVTIKEWIKGHISGEAYMSPEFDIVDEGCRRRAFYFRNANDLTAFVLEWKNKIQLR